MLSELQFLDVMVSKDGIGPLICKPFPHCLCRCMLFDVILQETVRVTKRLPLDEYAQLNM